MQGYSVRLYNSPHLRQTLITNSVFHSNYYRVNIPRSRSAFAIDIQNTSSSIYITDVSITNNTHASNTAGILMVIIPTSIVFKRCNYRDNHIFMDNVSNPPYSDVQLITIPVSQRKVIAEITDSNFIDNNFSDNSGIIDFLVDSGYFILSFISNSDLYTVLLRNSSISSNTGHYEGGIFAEKTCVIMTDLSFSSNIFSPSINYVKNIVGFSDSKQNSMIINSSFEDNSVTGLLLENNVATFAGVVVFSGNKSYNGGGMAVYGDSVLNFWRATMRFKNNTAQNVGGGLYAKANNCILKINQSTFEFRNNSARTAGHSVYGIDMYMCPDQWPAFKNALVGSNGIDLTSDPRHVCDCSAKTCSFNHIPQNISIIEIYPGQSFNLSLVAVGSLLNFTVLTGVPSTVYANLLPLHSEPGTIPHTMLVQKSKRACSELEYRVESVNQKEVMILAVMNPLNNIPENFTLMWQLNESMWSELVSMLLHKRSNYLAVPAYVEITLLPCPPGFDLYPMANANALNFCKML